MNSLAFWIIGMSIIGLSFAAEEEKLSYNQVYSDDEVEGKSCFDCHGGEDPPTTPTTAITHNKADFGWLWGLGGVAFSVLPILAVNIVGVILLAILLKHVTEVSEPAHYYQPAYVPQTSYQSYDGGANSYSKSGVAANTFSKRSVEQSPYYPSHSTLQFLTSVIGDAIDKYNNIDAKE